MRYRCTIYFIVSLLLLSNAYSLNAPVISPELIDKLAKKHGPEAAKRLQAWYQLIEENQDKPIMQKLKLVNQFFNQVTYSSDLQAIGKSDYWMTPTEFIINNQGDCEDFSIAKYFTLLAMGIPDKKLRITYVKAINLNEAHMVLTYYEQPSADPKVLDNLIPEILPASERKDLKPVYSFNGDGLWLARLRDNRSKAGSSDQIATWKNLLKRMADIRGEGAIP